MAVQFRNVEFDPHGPLDEWPYEALVTMLERGSIRDWAGVTREITAEPWGAVARQVEEYLSYEQPPGLAPLLERAIARARNRREAAERREIAARIDATVGDSGLTTQEFAARIGTSRSRLSTYRTGRVTPSAAMMLRIEKQGQAAASSDGRH